MHIIPSQLSQISDSTHMETRGFFFKVILMSYFTLVVPNEIELTQNIKFNDRQDKKYHIQFLFIKTLKFFSHATNFVGNITCLYISVSDVTSEWPERSLGTGGKIDFRGEGVKRTIGGATAPKKGQNGAPGHFPVP